jgi:hypothetical protein
MVTTLVAAAGAVLAIVAMVVVLGAARKFNALNESHWALRYEFARLRSRVAKIDGGAADDANDETASAGRDKGV